MVGVANRMESKTSQTVDPTVENKAGKTAFPTVPGEIKEDSAV